MPWKHEAVLKRRDVFEVDPQAIEVRDGWNPRKDFGGADELKQSIIENGVRVPLTVKVDGERIVLVDGERRLRAVLAAIAEGAEIVSVPAMLSRRGVSDVEAMIDALVKNDGKPLTATEEAEAFRRLAAWGMSQADIARRVGRSQPYVCGRLMLVDAAPEVKSAIDNKEVNIKAAARIVKRSGGSVEAQREGLKQEKEKPGSAEGNGFRPMSARKLEKLLAEYRGVATDHMNEGAKEFQRGVIAGLSMALFNAEEVNPKWFKG
jgi:ParB/RepB/Spo0J family partition protein